MRRVFFSNLVYVVLLNVLVKPLWVLGIDRDVQNVVGHSAYGLYFALFNLSFVFSIVIDMGITYHNGRTVAADAAKLNALFARAVTLKLLLAGLYLMASFATAAVWGMASTAFTWLAVLCASQVVQSFTLFFRSNLSGLHRYRLDSTVSIADRVLMIVLFGALLWSPLREHFSIDWFVYGQLACYVCAMLLAFTLNVRLGATLARSHAAMGFGQLLKVSYPYALVVLFMSIYYRADGILIERLVSDTEAGVYAAGYRLFDAANQFGFLFSGLLIPMFARLLARKERVQELAESGFGALYTFTTIAACGSVVYRQELMDLLYVASSDYQANVFAAVMCALPGSAAVFIFGTLLAVSGNLRLLNILTASAAVLNIVLNLWAIPRYGALGAAVTAAVTHGTVGLLQFAVSARLFGFSRPLGTGLRTVVFALASLLAFYSMELMELTWWFGLFSGVLISIGLAGFAGLLHIQQLAQAVRLRATR